MEESHYEHLINKSNFVMVTLYWNRITMSYHHVPYFFTLILLKNISICLEKLSFYLLINECITYIFFFDCCISVCFWRHKIGKAFLFKKNSKPNQHLLSVRFLLLKRLGQTLHNSSASPARFLRPGPFWHEAVFQNRQDL